MENYKKKQLDKIIRKTENNITGISDLTAEKDPSLLFYLLADKLSYLLENDPGKVISKSGVKLRKKLNYLIKLLGPLFLTNPQVIENRKSLLNPENIEKDEEIILPKNPVIYAPNHSFKDDTLASILAAKRHAYILFGSLPQFFNTFDGITSWVNGVAMVNRKVKKSKKVSISKATKAMNYGADLLVFPEGVWNKTPEKLVINLWPGIYQIAKETGAYVVPIAHYIKDCSDNSKSNIIHTVVDDAIKIDDLSEKAALEYLRDKIAYWYYLMMEKYGKSSREEELKNLSFDEAWEQKLVERINTVDRYDLDIELKADYRPKDIIRPEDVWQNIADINNISKDNITHVLYARKLIKEQNKRDFQRRF